MNILLRILVLPRLGHAPIIRRDLFRRFTLTFSIGLVEFERSLQNYKGGSLE